MVILPFMKHGDLHAFLLASRIGENPFVSAWGGSGQELERDKDPGKEASGWGGPVELVGRRWAVSLTLFMLAGNSRLGKDFLGEETCEAPDRGSLDS